MLHTRNALQYPTSFLLAACGNRHLMMDLQASNAEDDMSISLAQQAAAAQQSYAAASEYSYTHCLTLRRMPLPIATPLPLVLAHMIADITRPFIYIAKEAPAPAPAAPLVAPDPMMCRCHRGRAHARVQQQHGSNAISALV
jgi:hypothetical protein